MTFVLHPIEAIGDARADYRTGITVTELAALHGVSTATISKWCKTDRARHFETTKLPIWPLARFMHDRHMTGKDVLKATGIDIYAELREGWIGTFQADRIAVALGCHVWDIYGDLWWQSILGDQWDATNEYEETA